VPVTVAGDGVDGGVQLGSSVGNLSFEICHVTMDDDVGFAWALFGMVCVVYWEFLSSLASEREPRGGAALGPSAA
jgi:hypothetical protein